MGGGNGTVVQSEPTILEEDNQSLIRITLNSGIDSERTKHWDYKVHWLREKVQRGDITFAWVASADQMADSFTKALPRPAFELQRNHNMGIRPHSYAVHDKIFRDNAAKFESKSSLRDGYYVHYCMMRRKF